MRRRRPARIESLDDDQTSGRDDDLPLEDVTFVREARRKALWRRPGCGSPSQGCCCWPALLALQVAYQDRDRLASLAQPGAAPAAAAPVRAARCTLGRRADRGDRHRQLGLQQAAQDTYRLSFTLKNRRRAGGGAAMELTLTDAQDQPLMRRVLTPAELGAPARQRPPAAADWSSRGRHRGRLHGAPARIAGYRLLAFYP
jgi:hypothetical protein